MSFTAEQKSQLAKLLATENLTVQHQKLNTAKFDPKNRILYLPIWQNMTGIMYDLLVGHEVGHALYTPAEGWHDAVSDTDKNKNYKNFLNVVEDARIEKKVKRRYPGLNSSFRMGYQELNLRDFFGIKGRDVNELPFIDRLNLYSKSQWSAAWIRFNANEELLVKEVQAAETWDDVVRITNKIYEYSKDEQHEMALQYYDEMMKQMAEEESGEYDEKDYEGEDDDFDDEQDDVNGSGEGEADEDEFVEGETQSQRSQASNEERSDTGLDSGKSIQHEKESHPGDKDQFDPTCMTDESYRRNEVQLLDDKSKEYVYVDIPKPILKNIITPAKRVQDLMTKAYAHYVKEQYIQPGKAMELLNDFKRRNERYVSLLAKEFEMRKAAKSFSKSKLADTGDIDINKLSSYKFDDNIFRKVMLTPKGKSHGLVLLLDRSGSMSKNMAGSIEQILVLSMFCRKVNIPFVVYGFTESSHVRALDLGYEGTEQLNQFKKDYIHSGEHNCFTQNIGEMKFGEVHLREYLNSKMSNAEFTGALKNMCLLMNSYKETSYRWVSRPESEQLNNTPMTQAIVATAEIMKDFKRINNLDITSLVIVHDGDADGLNNYWIESEKINRETNQTEKCLGVSWYSDNKVYVMRDRKNKFESKITAYFEDVPKNVLLWFQKVTGSRIFGFFIVAGRGEGKYMLKNRYLNSQGKSYWQVQSEIGPDAAYEYLKALQRQFRDDKFVASKVPGYENFFFISGGEELTTDDEDGIEVEGKFTTRKLASAFAKYNKKRAVNRVLVSRFIQGIAA